MSKVVETSMSMPIAVPDAGRASDHLPPAVLVKNAWKSYDSRSSVLQGVYMKVNQGAIYVLLGSSGCGKTTLLSSIVGIRKLDQGDVSVFGETPGSPGCGIPGSRIGYMPQELSLYPELQINEVFLYFGRLYGLEDAEIKRRMTHLLKVLDLPTSTRVVGTLSGGQQRRTSLAVALIHEPQLLILDEPTAGVDPLLRQSIWAHLTGLVQKIQTTVIITTHYVEEAKNSHMIGVMRNGRMISEKSPKELLINFKTDSLERVLLSLSQNDDLDTSSNNEQINSSQPKTTSSSTINQKSGPLRDVANKTIQESIAEPANKPLASCFCSDGRNDLVRTFFDVSKRGYKRPNLLKQVDAVTRKNNTILVRQVSLLVIAIILPISNFTVSNFTIGTVPKNLRFGVVNPEVEFDLAKCDTISNSCIGERLSCKLLQNLPKGVIIPISLNSSQEALDQVKLGNLFGFMAFPSDYSNKTFERFALGPFADNETLLGSTISLRMDASHYLARRTFEYGILQAYKQYVSTQLTVCGEDPRRGDLPLNFKDPIYGHYDNDRGYTENVVIGTAVLLQFILASLCCLIYRIGEWKLGTAERSMVTGASFEVIFGGYMISHGANVIFQSAVVYAVLKVFFVTEIIGSDASVFLLLTLSGLAGIPFGFLLAESCREMVTGILILIGYLITSMHYCGFVWNTETFPYYLQLFVFTILPYNWTMYSFRQIAFKGWTLSHAKVWPGVAIVIGWGFVFAILSRIVHKHRRLR